MNKAIISAASLVLTAGLLGGLTGTAAWWQDTETISLQATKNVDPLSNYPGFGFQLGSAIRGQNDVNTIFMYMLSGIDLGITIRARTRYNLEQGLTFGYKMNYDGDPQLAGNVYFFLPTGLTGKWWLQEPDKMECNPDDHELQNFDSFVNLSDLTKPSGTSKVNKLFCFSVTNWNWSDTELRLGVLTNMSK